MNIEDLKLVVMKRQANILNIAFNLHKVSAEDQNELLAASDELTQLLLMLDRKDPLKDLLMTNYATLDHRKGN